MFTQRSAPKPRRLGFTLIELLVVIAIIAILAAILFPVFAKAREKARQTTCLSNEKQIGLGLLQYTQDYDETYTMSNVPGDVLCWSQQIYPYTKSADVYKCPDNPDAQTFNPKNTYYIDGTQNPTWMGSTNWQQGSPAIPVSYGLSNFVGAVQGIENGKAGAVTLAAIAAPASKIMVAERWGNHSGTPPPGCTGNTRNQDGIGWSDWDNNGMNAPYSYGCEVTAFHSKLSNFLFCDGHVKSMNPVVTAGNTTGQPNMWGGMSGNSAATGIYPACTQGDINCDNPDAKQQAQFQAMVNASP